MPTSASPLPFVENVGQFAEGAHFQLHGPNGNTLWLTNDGLWLTLRETEPPRKRDPIAFAATSTPAEPGAVTSTAQLRRTGSNAVNLRPKFEGANPTPRIEPFNRLDAKVSHLAGNDPAKWRPTVPVWGAVRYRDLYPGVDLELTSEAGG